MVVAIGAIVERLILCRVLEVGLVILPKGVVIVSRLELIVAIAHQLTLGEVLRHSTLGQRNTEKHKAKSHIYVFKVSH